MIVKCQWCEQRDTDRDEMEFFLAGVKNPQKKYIHKHCWEAFLKDKEEKDKERAEQDALNEVIMQIYGVKKLPNEAWVLLENLRHGNAIFGSQQKLSKRYKEGYSFTLLAETFDYCSETIEYHNSQKRFTSFMAAFRYGLAIIIDKVYFVERRKEKIEAEKRMAENHMKNMEEGNHGYKSNYKPSSKRNKVDISEFLDDEE